jgi:hypothetical protein
MCTRINPFEKLSKNPQDDKSALYIKCVSVISAAFCWKYFIFAMNGRPPLWSSGQSSWLQIQRFRVDSRRYQIFWEVVGLERGPFSLVSTTEELLQIKSSGSGLEIPEYGRRDPSHWPRGTLYPQKLAPTSLTSGGGLVGIVRLRTQATELFITILLTRSGKTTIIRYWQWFGSHSNILVGMSVK